MNPKHIDLFLNFLHIFSPPVTKQVIEKTKNFYIKILYNFTAINYLKDMNIFQREVL